MNSNAPRLVADIGGTNARFALYAAGDRPGEPTVVPIKDFPSLGDALGAFLKDKTPAPEAAAIAVAGTVTGDEIHFTNSPWAFSIDALKARCGFKHLFVHNDFAAVAMAIPFLETRDRRKIGGGAGRAETPLAVVGPGTGLGVSAVIPTPGGWQPLATEGGHVEFAPVDGEEMRILAYMQRRFAHVSAERLISGPGIAYLYRALADARGTDVADPDTAEVVRRAGQGDPLAKEAVDRFSGMLGGFAGNAVLTYGAWGGLTIAGGVVGKLGALFNTDRFTARFIEKGRFKSLLSGVPRWVITHPQPALLGLARDLDQRLGNG